MKLKVIVLSILFFSFFGRIAAQNDYYFYSPEDIANMKTTSQTEWGKKIIAGFQQDIEKRKQHDLRVPLMEGGHLHHYFCPKHNIMLKFDWDKPSSHYCSMCEDYWENNNYFDWAWINMVHGENLKYLKASMYLYMITQDTTYARNITDMMLDYANKYPTYMEHNTSRVATNKYSGRMYGQSLDESVWATDAARAYLAAKPFMTAEESQKIEEGYLKVCARMLLDRKGSGNWQVWHNSGLIALGVALGNNSLIDVALNDPKCGYHFLMDEHVYDDGWWNEGSPIYHYYPLRAMLLSAEAVRCRNIDLYDKKLYNMLASPALGVYADLFFPAHNDGWYGESLIDEVRLYEIACVRYKNDPVFLDVLKQCYQHTARNAEDALLNNVDPASSTIVSSLKSINFPDVGFAVLRSKEKAVVLKYGPHGGGHGHPDKLSISIHNGKKEILTDMGTTAYGVPDYTQWYRKTISHSTLTVDAKDQKETTGQLVTFKPSANGGQVEAISNEAYTGIHMDRSLTLKGDQLTDIFTATSKDQHQYDYVLILTEEPEFSQPTESATLEDAPGYKRISNIRKLKANKSIKCKLENGTEIHIESLATASFEVFAGEAPGIPPRNPAVNAVNKPKPCYPLIIRTTNKDMKIKTVWNIK